MTNFRSDQISKIFKSLDDKKKTLDAMDDSSALDEPIDRKKFLYKVGIFCIAIILPYLFFVEFFLKEEKIKGSDTFAILEQDYIDWLEYPEKYPEYDQEKVEYLDIYVSLVNFDDRENITTYRIDLSPSKALGIWDSGGQFQFYKSVRLNIDSIEVGSVGDFDSNTLYGSFKVSVIGDNYFNSNLTDSNYFPFEQKFSKLSIYAYYSESETIDAAIEKDNFKDLPIRIIDYTQDLEGYQIKYDFLTLDDGEYQILDDIDFVSENLNQGAIDLLITIKRDRATIFSVFVLMTFVVGAAIALLLMTIVVWSKRRPPALASLIWGAATIFAIIETRRFIPNTPRVGVYMDLYLFFPSILISIFATSSLFALWIRRKDWVA